MVQILILLLSILGAGGVAYTYGHKHATDACEAGKTGAALAAVDAAGQGNEKTNRTNAGTGRALDDNTQTFKDIRERYRHAPIAADPACRLSVDGLRLWNAATRGDTAGIARSSAPAVPRPGGSGER